MNIDWSIARVMVHTARAVYMDPHDFLLWGLGHGCDGVDIIPRRSTQIGITYSPTRIIIAARGSSQWGDWGENLLALLWRYRSLFPVGRMHLGFQIQTRRILDEFLKTIRVLRKKFPNAEVYVTGHSLGGALCIPILRILDLENVAVAGVYMFSSPRLVDSRLATWYDGLYGEKTFRVVAIRRGVADMATRLPPSLFGWSHVGRPIMVRDGHPYESESQWETARAKHPVEPMPWYRVATRIGVGVGAHFLNALCDEVDAIAVTNGGAPQ